MVAELDMTRKVKVLGKEFTVQDKELVDPKIFEIKAVNEKPFCTSLVKAIVGVTCCCCITLIVALGLIPVYISKTNIDPCKPNPCKQNGTCAASSANGTGGFTCSCPIGYQNSTTCDVYNECQLSSYLCRNGSQCYSAPSKTSKFGCNCLDGFSGDLCESYNSCWDSPCEGCVPNAPNSTLFTCTCSKFTVGTSYCQSEVPQPLGVSLSMITLNDGRLASSFDDNKIRISSNNNITDFYNYNNQSVILTGHTDFVNVIIQQQSSGLLLSGSCDLKIMAWNINLTAKQNIFTFPPNQTDCVTSLISILNDSVIISGSNDKSLVVWNLTNPNVWTSATMVSNAHSDWIKALAYSANYPTYFASCSSDKTVKVWSIDSKTLTITLYQTLTNHTDAVQALIFFKNYLISGSSDTTINVWSVSDSGITFFQQLKGYHTAEISTLSIIDDGLFASGSLDTTIIIWNAFLVNLYNLTVHKGRIMTISSYEKNNTNITMANKIASGSTDTSVVFWLRTNTLNVLRSLNGDTFYQKRQIEDIAIVQSYELGPTTPTYHIASASDDFSIMIWNSTQNYNYSYNLSANQGFHKNNVYALTVMQLAVNDNKTWVLASGSKDRSVIITNLSTYQPIAVLYGHLKAVVSLTPLTVNSVVGTKLASGSCDKTIIIWDLSLKTVDTILEQQHTDCINALATTGSLTTNYLISGSDDQTIRYWSITSPYSYQGILFNATSAVNALAVNSNNNNNFLVAGLTNGTIIVFNITNNGLFNPIKILNGHSDSITDLKFINNNNLASSSKDKTVRVWDMSTMTLLFTNSNHTRSVLCVNVLPNGNIVTGSEDKSINIIDSNLFTNITIIR